VAYTGDGLFDGTLGAIGELSWRFSEDAFDVAPIEAFFNDYYHPGLLRGVLSGHEVRASRDIADVDGRQPVVEIALTDQSVNTSGQVTSPNREVRIRLKASEGPPDATHSTGSGRKDFRLLRNGVLVRSWHGDLGAGGGGNSVVTFKVPIVAGENRFTAYCFNRDNVKSRDAELVVWGPDSIRRKGTAHNHRREPVRQLAVQSTVCRDRRENGREGAWNDANSDREL